MGARWPGMSGAARPLPSGSTPRKYSPSPTSCCSADLHAGRVPGLGGQTAVWVSVYPEKPRVWGATRCGSVRRLDELHPLPSTGWMTACGDAIMHNHTRFTSAQHTAQHSAASHSHVHLAVHCRDGCQLQPRLSSQLLEHVARCLPCRPADANRVDVAVVAALGPEVQQQPQACTARHSTAQRSTAVSSRSLWT